MTKIHLISDLHVDLYNNTLALQDLLSNKAEADILLNCGDLCNGFVPKVWEWYIEMSRNYRFSLFVFGNHDLYRFDEYDKKNFDKTKNEIHDFCIRKRSNIKFLDRDYFHLDNITIIGATLWSEILPQELYYIVKQVSDFTEIVYHRQSLTADIYNKWHHDDKTWLERVCTNKTIVATHHLPSYHCIHEYYKSSAMNSGWASNLDYIIHQRQPKYWFCGHTHQKIDILVDKTHIMSNPCKLDDSFLLEPFIIKV